MATNIGATFQNTLINHILNTTTYTPTALKVILTVDVPTPSSAGTEITAGGGYTAGGATITFGSASSGQAVNTAVNWTNMPACTIMGCRVVNTSGTMIVGGALDNPVTLAAGDAFTLAAGDIKVRVPA